MRRTISKENTASRWVGIAATSTLIDGKLFASGLERFAKWGVPVRVDERVQKRFRSFAGDDENRAEGFLSLLRDRNVGTIWCARGGYGATRLLSRLDKARAPALLRRDPKLLVGFSDVTALHLYVHQRTGLPSLHAPMPATPSWQKLTPRTDRLLRQTLSGALPIGRESHTRDWNTRFLSRAQAAEGVILGGNLTLLVNLIGTPWQPDLRGALLFLEDCAEAPYRVDRMLAHLENAGMLKGIRGILLGDFEADVAYREPKEKTYWKEIFLERFAHVPVLTKLPVGHGKKNEPLPLGVKAAIGRDGKLSLLARPVSP